MKPDEPVSRYGVHLQTTAASAIERVVESLRLLGYGVLGAGLPAEAIADLRERFDAVHALVLQHYGEAQLRALDEHNTIRCPLFHDRAFLDLALHPSILALCHSILGPGFILNQQNGLQNPPRGAEYGQSAYHRDLPYQHFVSSRPLAINALFCLDEFSVDNGSTWVIPASHKEEKLPSDAMIRACERALTAPAGSFLVLDGMTYHRGGANHTESARRAVNHVYSIGLLRQQIDLPAFLGEGYARDPTVRRILGYDFRAPVSPAEYYAGRRQKKGQ